MKNKILILVILLTLLTLSACAKSVNTDNPQSPIPTVGSTLAPTPKATQSATDMPSPTSEAVPSPTIAPTPVNTKTPDMIYKPKTSEDITNYLISAFKNFELTISLDMSEIEILNNTINNTIYNAYYNVLYEEPTLKYAYSIDPVYDSSTGITLCQISYMPYKMGEIDIENLSPDIYAISSYQDLISATEKIGGNTSTPIAITNPNLDFETMQLVLNSQCGYGYIVYNFNNDATQILADPSIGLTIDLCLQKISKIDSDATQIASAIVKIGMSDEDKIKAVYDYVTSTVVYDQRYYTDRKNMPFDSTTAYGAFENKIAICGGYANAFNILISKLGLECYNVTGIGNGESHMWNVAEYNGSYMFFDCTFDRGAENYNYFAKTQEYFQMSGHSWNTGFTDSLTN